MTIRTGPEFDKIEIRKDRPIPQGRGTNSMWPWRKMKVGDSFKIPDLGISNYYSVTSAVNRTLYPKHFIVRKTPEGFICWREK